MANPQLKNGYIKIANSLYEEIMLRNFSKREINAILLIIRNTYGCDKKFAIIPQYTKFFGACGIYKQDIKKVLEKLESHKVIKWDKNTNIFGFNKNFDEYVDNIKRLIDVIGIDHVGIGTDMDANFKPVLSKYSEFPKLADALQSKGFSSSETGKIMGENAKRVLSKILKNK